MKAKKSVKCLFVLFLILFALAQNKLCAQNSTCVDCSNNNVKIGYNNSINNAYQFQSILGNGNTTLRNNAVAIGSESFSRHSHSYVIGSFSEANGMHSFCIGSNSIAQTTYSYAIGYSAKSMFGNDFAIGNFVKTGATGGFVFGLGISSSEPLTNPVENSLAIGMKSTKPTLFISESTASSANNLTGKIGIGNVTAPQAKLHIRADKLEDASLLLEPSDPRQLAKLQLLDGGSGLTAGIKSGLQLFTNLEIMQFAAPQFVFDGPVKVALLEVNGAYNLPTTAGTDDQFLRADGTWAVPDAGVENYWQPSGNNIFFGNAVGIGMEPKERLSIDSPYGRPIHFHIGGSQGINNNAWYNGTNNVRSEDGPAYQISFSNLNMAFKTAENENAGSIVNWNEALVITQQGNVGIGTAEPLTEMDVNGNISVNDAIVGKIGKSKWLDSNFLTLLGSTDSQASKIMISKNNAINPVIKIMSPTESGEVQLFAGEVLNTIVRRNEFLIGNGNISMELKVSGKIWAHEVEVKLDDWWDEVFDEEYKLMPLPQLEGFIKEYKHLPDMPSEETVLKDGIELGEMNALLLKKVEELTLYVIELKKELDDMKQQQK